MTETLLGTDVISAAVELACRAPSLHNSQPWRWVATASSVDLFVDPRRVVASTDRSAREAVIGCGAALHHFRVAMAAAGWRTGVERFPNPNDPDHLAKVHCTPLDQPAQARRDLAAAISRRRTNRLPFRPPAQWRALEPVLRDCIDAASVRLDVLSSDARPRLAEAARLVENLRRYDDSYHRELLWWTAPARKNEGIPESALLSESDDRRVDVNRRFPVDDLNEWSSAGTYDEAKILVLSTPEDSRRDALACGEALSVVLLECTVAGLATCPVTHLTELAAGRDVIRDLIGQADVSPQVLVRVGMEPEGGPTSPPTPRRPVTDVLHIHR